MNHVRHYLNLCRVGISLFAACSSATGYFLGPFHGIPPALIPAAAVFLLACGASALNQYQERHIDAKMERTRTRPLPLGVMSPNQALVIACALILLGSGLLISYHAVKAAVLGLFALLWYNGVYTYLKRATAFAAVPGAAVGMIPPAIGWVAAGGSPYDPRLAVICMIFFLWQVPHFWLLMLNHGNDYGRAGLPSLTGIMNRTQVARITFAWIVAAASASLALPLYGSVRTPLVSLTLVPLAFWLIWSERSLIKAGRLLPSSPRLFRAINVYLFLIMSLLTAENIFFRIL